MSDPKDIPVEEEEKVEPVIEVKQVLKRAESADIDKDPRFCNSITLDQSAMNKLTISSGNDTSEKSKGEKSPTGRSIKSFAESDRASDVMSGSVLMST